MAKKAAKRAISDSEDLDAESEQSDVLSGSELEEQADSMNSDDIDEESELEEKPKPKKVKAKAVTPAKRASATKEKPSPAKKAKVTPKVVVKSNKKKATGGSKFGRAETSEEEEEEEQEETASPKKKVVSSVKLVHPPKEKVAKGCISKATLDFLRDLRKPECNDREWFAEHDPIYRMAWKQWGEHVDALIPHLQKADPTLPTLPAKDLTHRIYRDVRFSPDKRPYKRNLSASITRSGRKGPFAGYYMHIAAEGESILAGGKWCPDKNELATLRHNIERDPGRLRAVIEDPEFVKHFGEAAPFPPEPRKKNTPKKKPKKKKKGSDEESSSEEEEEKPKKKEPVPNRRRNIFGHEDELKVAPKGVSKDHPDIDLLRLRTIGVVHYFKDEEVLAEDFNERLGEVCQVMEPLVALINDWLVPNAAANGRQTAPAAPVAGSDGEE